MTDVPNNQKDQIEVDDLIDEIDDNINNNLKENNDEIIEKEMKSFLENVKGSTDENSKEVFNKR